ncbi:MAG: type II toxin-antitoxin system VapC family toxin [Chloroflexi bacterium]|nr:type II toxin-antitoxin system VapC family toxin [Chloroflexota bacterium]MDE2862832.1 type II toxin-antitoxin system VapC family toxin [Chloroflexota bacterium]MDE2936793.1 type II toxin-antitoxin system VapC family toxin [Chloroflexota bacterium]MXX66967.1 type II toxin-antitoxin system VapC family toxin [Chloroflexota bacterium]MXY00481.1 type II toxin-antitoxin system VapC family toxin [Chloroflexota bacterium]
MRYWDSSALVPLLVDEPSSGARRSLLESDPVIVTWWGTPLECEAALARLGRQPGYGPASSQAARSALSELAGDWFEVSPGNQVRSRASRLLRVHPLRAAAALQLAAALVAVREHSSAIEFVCNDERLAEAARLEGFATV